jgi:hypothetical protein
VRVGASVAGSVGILPGRGLAGKSLGIRQAIEVEDVEVRVAALEQAAELSKQSR